MPTGFEVGFLTIRYYGLMILVGITAALVLTAREAKKEGKT